MFGTENANRADGYWEGGVFVDLGAVLGEKRRLKGVERTKLCNRC